jgi:N-acyl-L-homoserine lactone synthetase
MARVTREIDYLKSTKIDKNVRDNNSVHILSGLFKLTYKWSLKNNINKWYFVTNKKYILLFKRLGFPVHIIGDGLKDNNNISIVPAVINLKEGARVIEKVNIEQYNFSHDYMQKESAN